jgi:tetratricopeptide (TPR) repeat protein
LQYKAGDRDAAIESLQKTAAMLPESGYVQTKLVHWLTDNGRAKQAIEYCNANLNRDPQSRQWLTLKREAQCEAGDFTAAWKTFQQLRALGVQRVSRSPDELNEQAYFRALAGDDLQTAADEIQQAISTTTYQSGIPDFQMPLPSQALLAAGMLSEDVETREIVLLQLSRRIKAVRGALEDRENMLVDAISKITEGSYPATVTQESALDDLRVKVEFRRRELAFLTVCRALILENLDQPDRCDIDRAHVIELGFDPQTVAGLLPDDSICQPLAMRAIAYLDTRGFILTLLPWTSPDNLIDGISTGKDAVTDLSIAITVSEVLERLLKTSAEVSDEERARFRKTFAAVLHHRVMANRKAGNANAIRLDRKRIESLGFDPDGNLY